MADLSKQRIFSAEQVVVRSNFPTILLDYSKEVIRANPPDLAAFSRAYFEQKLKETGFYADHLERLEVQHRQMVFQKGERFHQHYKVGRIIGDVTCSKARECVHKITKKEFAVKIYDKSTLPDLEHYMRSLEILNSIDHPLILNYREIFEDEDYLYFVSDYMHGGELYDAMVARGNYSEKDAAFIIKQLLQALAYLHSKNIVHRNIRAGNLLFEDPKRLSLKLIDFDFAGIKPAGENFFTKEDGNPVFESPEVIRGDYDEKSDIWSAGVMLYYLLSGLLPFEGYSNYEVAQKVLEGRYDLEEGDIWFFVSEEAKDLIRCLLMYNPKQRLNAVQALRHPWFDQLKKGKNTKPSRELGDALKNLYEFSAGTKLKQAMLAFFTKNLLTKQEADQMAQLFQEADKNQNGTLSREEISELYKAQKGLEFDEEELEELFMRIDADGSGEIDYSEWLMTAISKDRMLTQEKLEQAFALFDRNGDKQISYQEVVALLNQAKAFDQEAVERAVKEVDLKGRGQLSFKEFKRFMEKLFE